jgi:hypothetical protein
MRKFRWVVAVAPVLCVVGCLSGEKRKDSDTAFEGPDKPGELASRGKDEAPGDWLHRSKPEWMRGTTPDAPSWNNPTDPGYDLKTETKGLLAGVVENPEGRKVPNTFIDVREVGDTKLTSIGVNSDANGTFVVKGLKHDRNYVVTVHIKDGERFLYSSVYARTPNSNVRVALVETDNPPKLGTSPKLLDNSGPLPTPGVPPSGGFEIAPSDEPKRPGERGDLTTDGATKPWKSPTVDIPNSRTSLPELPEGPPRRR